MKKHKNPSLVPNKTLEIRKVARQMVAVGKPPRPIEIVAILKKAGIAVMSSQVSMALADTEFAFRQNREEWERPRSLFPDPTQALEQVSIEDVFKAREFVKEMGTLEKAAASIVALGQFKGGHTTPNAQQPPQMEENKDIRQNKTFMAEIEAAEQHREYPADLRPNDDWASRHWVEKDKK